MWIWKFEIHIIIAKNDATGQGKFDTLWMLEKCFTILANLVYKWYKCLSCKWYKCLRVLANAVANHRNVLRMKREHKTWVTNLHNTHCGCFSLSYICQALCNKLIFHQICTNCLHWSCILWKCQYECKWIFTNILGSLQMPFYQNELLMIAYEHVANVLFLQISGACF